VQFRQMSGWTFMAVRVAGHVCVAMKARQTRILIFCKTRVLYAAVSRMVPFTCTLSGRPRLEWDTNQFDANLVEVFHAHRSRCSQAFPNSVFMRASGVFCNSAIFCCKSADATSKPY
jgi:hypothetical protein